jgi:nitroreductase
MFSLTAMPHADVPGFTECADVVGEVIAARRTVLPKRLVEPGPTPEQWTALIQAAAAAPDHDQIQPWRFIRIDGPQRPVLGELFAQALRERDPKASPEQLAQAREKALRAPCLMLMVVDAGKGSAAIDLHERVLSAGCAVQNLLLLATAMGYGSALTSGKALKSPVLRQGFQLQDTEHAICFISLGTVSQHKPGKTRPDPESLVSTWSAT